MTKRYYELEHERDRLCSKRRLIQAQLNILDELIHEVHNEMEKELDEEFKDLEIKDCDIKEEK